MHSTQKQTGYTLVELIVVIAILVVLSTVGFVGYSQYSITSRDGARASDLKALYEGLKIIQAQKGKAPAPDQSLTINNSSGSLHALQGTVGESVRQAIGLESGGRDPQSGKPYTYYLYSDKKHFQLLGMFEQEGFQSKFAWDSPLTPVAYAETADLSPVTIGTKLWVVLDTPTETPINEILTGSITLASLAASGATVVGSPVSSTGWSVVMTPAILSILNNPLATLAFEFSAGITPPSPPGSVIANSSIFGIWFNSSVSRAVKSGSSILFVGDFTSYKGSTVSRVALVDPITGNITPGFLAPTVNGMVYDTKVQSDGKIMIAGTFTSVGGTARWGIARLNTDGSLDTTFNPGTGFNSAIYSLDLMPNGHIVTAGPATSYDGTALPSRIAMITPTGSLDPSFDLGAASIGGYYVNGVTVGPTGSIYLANENSFYKVSATGTVLASAACAGTTNQIRALANGKVSVTCNNLRSFQIYDGDLNLQGVYGNFASIRWGRVYGVHPLADNTLIAVGEFTDTEGIDSQLFARYGSDGVFNPSLSGTGTQMNPIINGRYTSGILDIDADKFLIFGAFDELRGETVNNIAYIHK